MRRESSSGRGEESDAPPSTVAFLQKLSAEHDEGDSRSGPSITVSEVRRHAREVLEETVLEGIRLRWCIGDGAASRVFVGWDPRDRDDPLCTVKVLRAGTGEWEERFEKREWRALKLWRPGIGIPRVRRTGSVNEHSFVVMDYTPGFTLKTLLHASGNARFPSPVAACEITANLARTLYLLHEDTGLIHRDIKPGNVLICDTGEVLLLDFGLARMEDDTTVTDPEKLYGTLRYIAPEQAEDAQSVTAKADVFSLGMLTAEMLTGRIPLPHMRVLHPERRHKPDFDALPETHPAIAQMLGAMLAHRPDERPDMLGVSRFFHARSGFRTLPFDAFLSSTVSDRNAIRIPAPRERRSGDIPIPPSAFGSPEAMLAVLDESYRWRFPDAKSGNRRRIGVNRRDFLKAAGLMAGGTTALGASIVISSLLCREKQPLAEAAFNEVDGLETLRLQLGEKRWDIAGDDCVPMTDGSGRAVAWVFHTKPEQEEKIEAKHIGFLFSRPESERRTSLIVLPDSGGFILLTEEEAHMTTKQDPDFRHFLRSLPSPVHGSKTPRSWGRYYTYGRDRGVERVMKLLRSLLDPASPPPGASRDKPSIP